MAITTAPPPTPVPPTYGCTGDYVGYSGFCYKHNDIDENYDTANARCKQDSAELVSIHSSNENNFLLAYVSDGKICVNCPQVRPAVVKQGTSR